MDAVETPALSRKTFWTRIGVLAGVVALLTFVHLGVVFTMTPSVKYTVLLVSAGPAHKGDYVTLEFYHQVIHADRAVKLTKRVACVAGDSLKYSNGHHYCNGAYLDTVLTRTTEGMRLPLFEFDGQIPDGMVFLVGDHERSFDSRYFGLVKADALQRLTPIF